MVRSGSERCGRVGSGKLGFGFRGCARCDTVRFGTVWKGMGFTVWSGEAGRRAVRRGTVRSGRGF
jgi:hypothetical protein